MSLVISKVFTYDTDAGNYIQAVEAADTVALEPAVRQAINNFVVGCKQDGIWSAIKASCILAGAKTLEGSFIDLKSATKILTNNNFADGTYVGSNYTTGDYNRKTGLIGNGFSTYLNSNRAGNADPEGNHHISVQVSSSAASGAYIGSQTSGSPNISNGMIYSAAGQINFRSRLANVNQLLSTSSATGFMGVSRSNTTTQSARILGTTTVASISSTAPGADSYFVFANNNLGGGPSLFSTARLAFYSIGEAIDLAKLDSRVTDLITAFGAAIP